MQVVREKLYRNLHQEVPYNARVMPVSFKTLTDGSWRFEQNIVVPTNHVSHPHVDYCHIFEAACGLTHACYYAKHVPGFCTLACILMLQCIVVPCLAYSMGNQKLPFMHVCACVSGSA